MVDLVEPYSYLEIAEASVEIEVALAITSALLF